MTNVKPKLSDILRDNARIQALVKNGQVTTLPETRVSRWWLVLPPLTLLAGVLAAVRWTAPRDVKGTETAGHWGYR